MMNFLSAVSVCVSFQRDDLDAQVTNLSSQMSEAKENAKKQAIDFDARIKVRDDEVTEVRAELAKVKAERDQIRNNLIEAEIANHEGQTSLGQEREKVKMDVAKLTTEKETLQVTLQHREEELKNKKEEFRKNIVS